MPSALTTDLYELTMMAGYYAAGMRGIATFELYVRDMPGHRRYLVAAGLEQALDYLESLRFEEAEIDYLRRLPGFERVPAAFFDEHLPSFRFTGEVWAMEEGTPAFANEPLLRVTAPMMEAQLVETALLAIVGFQTSIASKAARVVHAAAERPVVEFGARRAHGPEAALHAARAAFLGGCAGTSNVEAGKRFGIPLAGTMAHSWVMSFPGEMEAFRAFWEVYREGSVFLIDTYDTVAAARKIASAGLRASAVRLDSGDVAELSRDVRKVLDEAGLNGTGIFVSGDLDEHRIAALLEQRVPVSGFGVGTSLTTSRDAPALGAIYKLVEIEREGRLVPAMKLSESKRSLPGRKQVWRRFEGGVAAGDVIALADEPEVWRDPDKVWREPSGSPVRHADQARSEAPGSRAPGHVWRDPDKVWRDPDHVWRDPDHVWRDPDHVWREPDHVWREPSGSRTVPLLGRVMANGTRLGAQPPLAGLQKRCRERVRALPESCRRLDDEGPRYPVEVSPALDALARELAAQLGRM